MAIIHTWSVQPALKTRNQDSFSDVVYSVTWKLVSKEDVDGTIWSTNVGQSVTLNTDNLDSSTFTAFANLTETQVVAWAKAQIDADAAEGQGQTCAEWEQSNANSIALQQNPPERVLNAPWTNP